MVRNHAQSSVRRSASDWLKINHQVADLRPGDIVRQRRRRGSVVGREAAVVVAAWTPDASG
jgi:hypothetical protein